MATRHDISYVWLEANPPRERALANYRVLQSLPTLARVLLQANTSEHLQSWFEGLKNIRDIQAHLKKGTVICVAMHGTKPVGLVQFEVTDQGNIRNHFAAVHPDYRGREIGKALFRLEELHLHHNLGGVVERVLVSKESVGLHRQKKSQLKQARGKVEHSHVKKITIHTRQEHPVAHIHIKPAAVRRVKNRRR